MLHWLALLRSAHPVFRLVVCEKHRKRYIQRKERLLTVIERPRHPDLKPNHTALKGARLESVAKNLLKNL